MLAYKLPLEAARARLTPDKSAEAAAGFLSERDRELAYGRRMAALVIAHALQERSMVERTIGTPPRLTRKGQAVASGWVLCERLAFDASNKSSEDWYDLRGLLLSRESEVFSYGTKLRLPGSTQVQQGVDAWGRQANVLPESTKATVCGSITRLNLGEDPHEVDMQVGPVAGSLSIDDLFAGLVVRKRLSIPEQIAVATEY